ncbi:MAG: NAD(P)-dependent oxidoreductase [Acidimicrobiia bacterium]|nr:NAD(P)-dependent oxidoreductase [Acidimicrobiia bacterium]
MSASPRSVAVVGVGRMGGAMAARFAGAGHKVTVWNRDRAKADRVAEATGAGIAQSAADAAARAEVVVSSLADDDAVKAVYLGPTGIVEGIGDDSIAVDTSTVDPETIMEVGAAIDEEGSGFLDCPVSGSVATVEAGALTIMAGGDADLISAVEGVLGAIGSKVIRVGPRGTGAAAKLAVNGLVHGLNIALSEALVLAETAGISRDVAYEIFASGAGGAPFVHYKREAYLHPDETPVAFSLDLVAKDLTLITAMAKRVGAPMRQASVGLDVVNEAIGSGLGHRDLSAIAVHLRARGA